MEKRLDISASHAPFCFGENLFLCEPVLCVRFFTPNKLLFSTTDVSVVLGVSTAYLLNVCISCFSTLTGRENDLDEP